MKRSIPIDATMTQVPLGIHSSFSVRSINSRDKRTPNPEDSFIYFLIPNETAIILSHTRATASPRPVIDTTTTVEIAKGVAMGEESCTRVERITEGRNLRVPEDVCSMANEGWPRGFQRATGVPGGLRHTVASPGSADPDYFTALVRQQ